jgi:hypothetical protein
MIPDNKPKGVYVQMPDTAKEDLCGMVEWGISIIERMDEENQSPFSDPLRSDIGNFIPNAKESIDIYKQK